MIFILYVSPCQIACIRRGRRRSKGRQEHHARLRKLFGLRANSTIACSFGKPNTVSNAVLAQLRGCRIGRRFAVASGWQVRGWQVPLLPEALAPPCFACSLL